MNTKRKKLFLITFAVTLLVIIAVYLGFTLHFKSRFYFGSYINGINYSNKTVSEVEDSISKDTADYVLQIKGRDNLTDIISADDIDYAYVSDGSIQKLKDAQNPFKWIFSMFSKNSNDMQVTTTYDEDKLDAKIQSLKFFQSENNVAPTDAHTEYKGNSYKIVPETLGSKVKRNKLTKAVKSAIQNGDKKLSISKAGCYTEPSVTSDSNKLKELVNTLNKYAKVKITYNFEYTTEVVDSSYIRDWMEPDDKLEVNFNLEKVRSYIDSIAKIYNTYGKTRDFVDHDGKVIEISGGDYGWLINRADEVEHLVSTIKEGKDATIEPIYSQSARSRAKNDIGDSYIEIDLSKQHVWVYENGKLVVDTDCVTGNSSQGHDTPSGIFQITYKEKDATLVGENYSSSVTYWMPFYYNVGLHDATWRNSFGGSIYKNNGSHGCVNLPFSAAEKVFHHIEKGTPVVVYNS